MPTSNSQQVESELTPFVNPPDSVRSQTALAVEEDDSAAREILASGVPIHIARDDTPPGHVIRVHPDGREEIIRVDREAAAAVLGR